MFTYQVRKRYFKLTDGREPSFPNTFEAVFTLQPAQPFGMSPGGGKTTVQSVGAGVYFNANTGHHFVESKQPLRPLEVIVEAPDRKVELCGNVFKIKGRVESLTELEEMLLSVYFGLPILLNVEFADPPIVERVDGKVSGDGQTMEAARAGLGGFGCSPEEIDRDFIPAMVLRSNIDSAHVDLSLFTQTQLRVLHAYTEAAEMAFRQLLSKILTEIEAGRYQVAQHTAGGHDSRTANIIERLAKHFGDK